MMAKSMTLFEPIDITHLYNAPNPALDALLRPMEVESAKLLPAGAQLLRGIPFAFADSGAARRWLWVDSPVSVAVGRSASFIVFAHACPLSHEEPDETPELEFMARAGEGLAKFVVVYQDQEPQEALVRRRFEVSEWTNNLPPISFASVGHAEFREVDWRGPHAQQGELGWGPPGSSSMAGFPGVWGMNQAGITDDHMSGDPWYSIFLLQLEHPDSVISEVRLEPVQDADPLANTLIGGITLFMGQESPLAYASAHTLRFSRLDNGAPDDLPLGVDLGLVGRRRPAIGQEATDWTTPGLWGWGARAEPSKAMVVEAAWAADATLSLDGETFSASDLDSGEVLTSNARIEVLPPARTRTRVRIVDDATGRPTAARVHFRTEDGRYLPPEGHRVEINAGLMEDYGADVQLGTTSYAYVPGEFDISLPIGTVHCEIAKGFEYAPIRTTLSVDSNADIELRLTRPHDFRREGWITADTHVHFVPPTTALLEAQAEGINMVHVLAIQVGNLFANIADFAGSPVVDADTETSIWLGSENRQPFLGHISLLNTGRPIFPISTGGASTSHLGDPVEGLMADWADQCRRQGGLVVASHFPFPYGEIVADIVAGKIDAVEIFGFGPEYVNPRVRDWYRFLNAGYRVPAVGGTDKMSAGTPIGAVRTYAHVGDEPPTFASWMEAIVAGRTFVTSGPLVTLAVDGKAPGETIELPDGGGNVAVEVQAVSLNSLSSLEVVVNGRTVARVEVPEGTREARLTESIRVTEGSWIAARCTTPDTIWSAFPTAVAAHTSPVYVTCAGRSAWVPDDASTLLTMLDGGVTWAETLAVAESAAERERYIDFFVSAHKTLKALFR